MNKTAIVTGSAGFIGSNLCEYLLNKGWTVIGLDDYSAGYARNYWSFGRNVNFYSYLTDVSKQVQVEHVFNRMKKCGFLPATIFHNAAAKKVICMTNPRRDLEVNAGGTFNLLEAARKYDIEKFVHASTGSVYGEQCRYMMNELHPLCPISFYGVSKLAGERYVGVFNEEYGLNTTTLRYFHVYGPKQDYSYNMEKRLGYVIPIFIQRIMLNEDVIIHGDGEQQRSFTSVHDVVRANEYVVNHPCANGQVYNCASGIQITVGRLAHDIYNILLEKRNTRKVHIVYDEKMFGDPQKFRVSNAKLKSIGFNFQVDSVIKYRKALAETIDWYLQELF